MASSGPPTSTDANPTSYMASHGPPTSTDTSATSNTPSSDPPKSPDTNLTENVHKLAKIFGAISIGWVLWLVKLEDKPNVGLNPTWWNTYSLFNLKLLVGWSFWIVYMTMRDENSNRKTTPGGKPNVLWNLLHIIPMLLLHITINKSMSVKDKGLLWFSALVVFRYWRAIVTRFFYARYKLATVPTDQDLKFSWKDCTVIVPTVGPKDNPVFKDMVAAIFWNKPERIIFSANNPDAKRDVETEVANVVEAFIKGETKYQTDYGLGKGWEPRDDKDYTCINTNESNKRKQTDIAIEKANTDIILMVDDTAIWHPRFLRAVLPAFNDPRVGIVGTRKRVQYRRPSHADDDHKEMSRIEFCLNWYHAGLWNTIGAQYLDRHSYEIRASNTADGSVFAISARTLAIRKEIVKNEEFKQAFENEYVLERVFKWATTLSKWPVPFASRPLAWLKGKGFSEKGVGPLLADDDNFITRWVINRGWNIKVQSSPEATMTTVLGSVKIFKYLDQCERWSRTTFRQNPIAIFEDRTIWWKWPIGVWTVYFPWMYNFAVFWDGLVIFAFMRSGLYQDSSNGSARLVYLILAIWATKLIKTWRWFLEHPLDFFLYFVIPAYPLFVYYHSWIKLYTALSCWNNEWSGRNIRKAEEVAGIVAGIKEVPVPQEGSRLKKE
ncbi:uncharacterized protein J4E78_007901 [Alternaria triticimaculans]|uniref:uncharacterized protein n=1 Tax=Alternaria triticimaculans TaxID=297637 RepID=UPI0020C23240|nr:uncharacterized protein J4E78_007901 [Alternaria triticimaculans]KAI4651210.1 hypothetical protein J4E78_007901 [Alternaria triticimaculans]